MELQDLNTEAEDKEDEESRAEHSQLRIQIASVESAVGARILGREIRDKIDSLAKRETLQGCFVKGQLDDIKSQLSQLYALWDGVENSEEVKTLVHELKADFTRLNRRFADEEPNTGSESTLSDKSITITRDAVRLPHLELPTLEGDPLQWKTRGVGTRGTRGAPAPLVRIPWGQSPPATVFPWLECALYYIAPSNTRLQMPLDQLN